MGIKKFDHKGVIEDYLSGMDTKEIVKKHKLNDINYIYHILKKNNIKTQRNYKWTPQLIGLLSDKYPTTEWDELLIIFKPFSKEDIFTKASKLKIKRLLNAVWTEDDINILKEYFGKVSSKELQELLPYRSVESINTKANKIGLESRIKWSEDEIDRLKREYPYHLNDELSRMFGNRTADAIMGMAVKLGLSKDQDSHLESIYNKNMLILEFQDFAIELGRTPIGIEVSANKNMAHAKTYERYFGSYIGACKAAGLVPCYDNSVYVTRAYYSKNNDICLSQAELQITNLYIDNGVEYKKEVLYRDLVKDDYCGYKRCDWVLGDLIVEYFGMPERESYQKRIVEKREICKRNDLQLLELYPEDIKRGKNLEGLIKKFRLVGINLILENIPD